MTAPGAPAPTVSPVALPRAGALTDALVAPGPVPGAAAVATVRRQLERGLSEAAGLGCGPVPCLRVRAFDLVRAADSRQSAPATAFCWTARTARRRVGLAAVRACLAHPGLAPADAVAGVVADPGGPGGTGPRGPGSCADWLATLSPPARALVQAEAAAWATALVTALEWDRAPSLTVGAPDRWWDWRGKVRVALQGRADVRLQGPGGAHLLVLGGFPSPAARAALSFSALVDALRSDGAGTPARVVAWWPDCGKAWAAQTDEAALRACAGQVLATARRMLGARVAEPPALTS